MSVPGFVRRQIDEIRRGGKPALLRKLKRALWLPYELLLLVLVLPVIAVVRLLAPWQLVRWGELPGPRIGHFAANTELYLCELDAGINSPKQRHFDVLSIEEPICNSQLAIMWRRVLRIWPGWLVNLLCRGNRLIPGGAIHEIGSNTQHDRDVHNLLDCFPPHLQFSEEEKERGEAALRKMGIPAGAQFVCLIVRDRAYLDAHQPGDWSYHNYRDSSIQNYVLAADELAARGYYVLRMGAKVLEPVRSSHLKVIDYATNGMRTDFMDIYLGANCAFCISVSTGFDAVPLIFRRPIVYVNMVPLGYLPTYRAQFVGITKHHWSVRERRELTLCEITANNLSLSLRTADYESKGVELRENTPEEIRDAVVEMHERLTGTWRPEPEDEVLQRRFWELYPVNAKDVYRNVSIHGEIRARFGARFLRANPEFLN